jgi:hypothetical protein
MKRAFVLVFPALAIACSGGASHPNGGRPECSADFVRAAAAAAAPAVPADGTCVVEPAACYTTCARAGCLVTTDAEIRCADPYAARRGLRVTPSRLDTYVAIASDDETHVFEIGPDGTGADIGAPLSGAFNNPLMLAVDGGYTLHAVGNGAGSDGGYAHATRSGGAWSRETVQPASPTYAVSGAAFEIGPDEVPRVLLRSGPDEYTLARGGAGGQWTTDAPDAWQDFTMDAAGAEVRFRTASTDSSLLLEARTANVTLPGFPIPNSRDFRVTHGLHRLNTAVPPFAVATYRDGGLRLAWPSATSYTELAIPNTQRAYASCTSSHDPTNCTGTCDTQDYGVQNTAFSLARTDDGAAWLAYLVTRIDFTCHLGITGSDNITLCGCSSIDDRSVGELHVLRAPPDASPPVEVLVLPLEPQLGGDLSDGLPLVHARAYRSEVAIAARVRGPNDRPKLRVLTLSTNVAAN